MRSIAESLNSLDAISGNVDFQSEVSKSGSDDVGIGYLGI